MKTNRVSTLAVSLFLLAAVPPLLAQPGSGIRVGQQTLLIPELSLSMNHNDNIRLRERALDQGGEDLEDSESDTFLNAQTTLFLRHWSDSSQINGKAWFNTQNYNDNRDLDENTYGGDLSYFWARADARTTVKTDVSFQRAVDRTETNDDFIADIDTSPELENVAERVERDERRGTITIDQHLMTDVRGEFTYGVTAIDYDHERYNDRTSHSGQLEINYTLSEKTQPYGRMGIGIDDDDGFEDPAEKPFYLVGVRHAPTPKLDFDVAVGYETYTRTPNEGVDEGKKLEDSSIKWTARVNYAATKKTRATLSGRTGYNSVASPGSSSREESSISLLVDHQTTRQASQRVTIAWREDDYLSPFPARGQLYDEKKETLLYQYRIDYQTVRPWLSLFGQVAYEDGSSRIPGDSYTETEITLGVKLRY